eukprot:NODE_17690_length_930_cov_12.572852.p4 GENE.NODE_17690_length_930_cov_12.572852~~NODE_17690_length_930_cov_12.572852.p4  ORF type:complete len:53 (+),score=5.24 NODE_17690_length_930_cov_12.572852:570-728(+)
MNTAPRWIVLNVVSRVTGSDTASPPSLLATSSNTNQPLRQSPLALWQVSPLV